VSSISQTFARIGLSPSPAQLCFARAILGEPLSIEEQEIYKLCTGREDYQQTPHLEADGIVGRKGGKTELIATPLIVHRACTDAPDCGTYLVCAPSKSDQARIGWEAINRQLQRGFPGMIAEVKESDGRILLQNGNIIKVASANFRHLRGPKYVVVVVDEAAFFTSDDPELGFANPLAFVLDSIAGGMVASANPLLVLLTTP
jgi:phage terminase large subunit-like protein